MAFLVSLYAFALPFAARAHGWKGGWTKLLGKVTVATSIGLCSYLMYGSLVFAACASLFAGWAFSLGHGRFFGMNGANLNDPAPEKLELWIQKLYQRDITKPLYSWFCMAAKGLLIGLFINPFGFISAITWPVSYWLGMRVFKRPELSEWISGSSLSLILILVYLFYV